MGVTVKQLTPRKNMSAYIVNKEHILYLVQSAISLTRTPRRHLNAFRWYFGNPTRSGEIPHGDYEKAAEAANMLWQENIKSVSCRYPGESSGTLPGPRNGSFVVEASDFSAFFEFPNLIQVLKACDAFEYQSCEHDEWQDSEACAFINSLRKQAWTALPGYEEAAWGAPEPKQIPARLRTVRGAR